MTETEHLLVCLSEECAEIIKAVSKALRFGLDDGYPGGSTTNLQDIIKELNDLEGVIDLLRSYVPFENFRSSYAILKKKDKIKEFMEYARKRNKLEK